MADEETCMDSADLQQVNQEGSASDIVEGAEYWTWDEVAQEYGDSKDGTNNNIIELSP